MSDQDTNIFNKETQQQDPVVQQDPQPTNPYEDLLKDIVAEDGRQKYDNIETALKALKSSQEHISTIESENRNYKELEEKVTKFEDILSNLNNPEDTKEKPSDTEILDTTKVVDLVNQTLSQKAIQDKQTANVDLVINKMISKFGDKASEAFNNAAKDAGLSIDQFNKLAGDSPAAVLKLVGVDSSSTIPVKTTQTINTDAFSERQQNPTKSAKINMLGSNTSDLVNAWKAAGDIVKSQN